MTSKGGHTWLVVAGIITVISGVKGAAFQLAPAGTGGLCFSNPALWIQSPVVSAICAVGLLLLCAVGLIFLVKRVNFVHSTTVLYSTVMLLGIAPFSVITSQFGGPVMMLAATIICMALLMPDFGKPSTAHIFLAFSTLAFGATCQSAFLGMILVMLAGCITLQFTQPRMLTAALLGIVAPLWILCGIGVADVRQLALPQLVTIFNQGAVTPETSLIVLLAGVMALLTILLTLSNSVKVFAANSGFRASNRFIIILSLGAIILPVIDIRNLLTYIPVLSMTLGIQAAHFYNYRICRRY